MVDILPPQYKILLTLLLESDGGEKFTNIQKKTNLSSATVGKWLKILQLMGIVEKSRDKYDITESGIEFLRTKFSEMTKLITAMGLSNTVELGTIPMDINLDITDEDYIISFKHYGDYGDIPVKVYLPKETKDEILKKLYEIIRRIEGE